VEKGGLNNFSTLEKDATPHQMEEEDRKGDDTQTAALKKHHCDNLACKGQVFAIVNNS
jgi:hypothetical protein